MFYVRLATSVHKRSTCKIILWIMNYWLEGRFFSKMLWETKKAPVQGLLKFTSLKIL